LPRPRRCSPSPFQPSKRGRKPTEIEKLFGADVAGLVDDLTDYLDRNKAAGLTAGDRPCS
jgi:hypothetical protein